MLSPVTAFRTPVWHVLLYCLIYALVAYEQQPDTAKGQPLLSSDLQSRANYYSYTTQLGFGGTPAYGVVRRQTGILREDDVLQSSLGNRGFFAAILALIASGHSFHIDKATTILSNSLTVTSKKPSINHVSWYDSLLRKEELRVVSAEAQIEDKLFSTSRLIAQLYGGEMSYYSDDTEAPITIIVILELILNTFARYVGMRQI
ncbi:hypothetical protein EJ08DRAFT_722995 [Tothia fuscella]|uniref:Uncharacterized protein n=1 Tax=Tothia fuscella TaxID=1048955 RepID=A0A9P4NKK2_9PEZI|nr:hypothetical protein EJ08DRAFT_722995 [Tothia fuscella]